MGDKSLMLVSVCVIGLVLLLVVYMNNKSKKELSQFALANSALIVRNTEAANKANLKDYLTAGTSALSSVADIISSVKGY